MAKGYLGGVMLGLVVSVGAAVGLSLLAGGPVMQDTAPDVAAADVPAGSSPEAPAHVESQASLPAGETRPETAEAPKVAVPASDMAAALPSGGTEPAEAPVAATASETLTAPAETAEPAPVVAGAATDEPVGAAATATAPVAPSAEPETAVVAEPAARPEAGAEAPQAPTAELAQAAQPALPAGETAPDAGSAAPAAIAQPEPASALLVAEASGAAPEPSVQASAPDAPASPETAADTGTAATVSSQPVEIAAAPSGPAVPGSDSPVTVETAPAVKAVAAPAPAEQPTESAAPAPEVATAVTEPQPAAPAEAEADPDLQSTAEAEPAPAAPPPAEPAPAAVVLPEVAAETEAAPAIRIGKPATGFKTLGNGVQTGRLAAIGQEEGGVLPGKRVSAMPGSRTAAEATAPAPTPATVPAAVARADLPPVQRFAAPFEDPENKPKMAIVLIDETDQPVGIEALSSFPYPLSFAVDTSRSDAADRMAIYRAAGFEVLAMVALPQGATPADVEVAMPVLMAKVPEAVAVMESPGDGIQFDRRVSDQVTRILADTGHGLLLFPKGLNTAEKLAAKNGVRSSVIFRDIDGKDQKTTAIRRFLNYGALNAGNEGGVVLVGRLKPDTVTALLLWGLEDRAQQIALAPVSQLLTSAP